MEFKQVKLPRRFKGARLTEHPLIAGLEAVKAREECSMRSITRRYFDVTEQALFIWLKKARINRDFNVPPRQVIPICRLTGQPPYIYNPELWPDPEWRV